MSDGSEDGGGFLILIVIVVVAALGAGAFLFVRVTPAVPPRPVQVAPTPAPTVPVAPVPTPAPDPVSDEDLTWAKDGKVSLVVTKCDVKTAPNGVQRWIVSFDLKNGGTDPLDVQRPGQGNVHLETRTTGSEVVSHGDGLRLDSGARIRIEPGQSVSATVGWKFPSALSGGPRRLRGHTPGRLSPPACD